MPAIIGMSEKAQTKNITKSLREDRIAKIATAVPIAIVMDTLRLENHGMFAKRNAAASEKNKRDW
jgi:hypothetical protein